ncbi:MAG TPA: hypothetical protein VKW76_15385 [Candidatus Binatia bacterium]|nr:hypothetical protein [Candidatus Binatia bacterium]
MTPVTLAIFLLGLLVIVAVSVFVAAPLFGPAGAPAAAADDDTVERERWERQKRQALGAIREAEMDRRMGKLSDEDFHALRARLEAQALEALAALEREPKR